VNREARNNPTPNARTITPNPTPTIAICVAIGLIAFFAPLSRYEGEEDAIVGVGFGVIVLAFGVGLFLASRFTERPAPNGAGVRAAD